MATKMINLSSSNMDLVYDALTKFIKEDKFSVGENQFVTIPEVLVDGKPALLDTRFIFNQPTPPTADCIKRECLYLVSRSARATRKYQCGVCCKETRTKCNTCRMEYYCSVECQTQDWVWHRAGCQVAKSRRLNQCCRVKCSKILKPPQFGIPCDNCPAVRYCSPKCRHKDKNCHQKSGYCDLAKKEHEDPKNRKLVEEMMGMSLDQLYSNPQEGLQKLFNPKDFANFE